MSRQLQAFLTEFVEAHRGLRLGMMLGARAAYAGRRMFARLVRDGIACRLPPGVGRTPSRARRRTQGSAEWVVYRPRTRASLQRLVPLLELAARHAALTAERRTR